MGSVIKTEETMCRYYAKTKHNTVQIRLNGICKECVTRRVTIYRAFAARPIRGTLAVRKASWQQLPRRYGDTAAVFLYLLSHGYDSRATDQLSLYL
jgi:hypothetical protein